MLIVEDGTMPTGANSYISLADADDYAVTRGLWPASNDDDDMAAKEKAIIRACDWLNTMQWLGKVAAMGRVMAFPRVDALDYTSETPYVPYPVSIANVEAAVLFYNGTDVMAAQSKGVKAYSKKSGVDVISESESFTYDDDAPTQDFYQSVVGILRPYLAIVEGEAAPSMMIGKAVRC